MKPIEALTSEEARRLDGLLFDLDDTLLDEGHLTEAAYSSLFRLRESGLTLVALTGRPAAWAELIARQWPVEAAIAENGALGFRREGPRVVAFDSAPPAERAERKARLAALVKDIRRELPELVPADDVGGRQSDFTFDIREHRSAPETLIQRAQALGRAAGANTFRSSVHLHFGFDRHDKASGALGYLAKVRGVDPTRARFRYAFIGDSENDAPCFAAFSTTIGVANLRGLLSLRPAYVTRAERGAGFVEAARVLVARRRDPQSDDR